MNRSGTDTLALVQAGSCAACHVVGAKARSLLERLAACGPTRRFAVRSSSPDEDTATASFARLDMSEPGVIAAVLFGLALIHTFATKKFEQLAGKYSRHASLFHFFLEVEVVFGLWALVLILATAMLSGGAQAIEYAFQLLGLLMFLIGFTKAYEQYQNPLILKEGLLVGFFFAGLVALGEMQQWWLQPIVSDLEPTALFLGATALAAIADNAALTYLGSLIAGMSDQANDMLVAGAVAGGGLTVIANAPNRAGVALLRDGFNDESIGVGGLLLGALPTPLVAMVALFFSAERQPKNVNSHGGEHRGKIVVSAEPSWAF